MLVNLARPRRRGRPRQDEPVARGTVPVSVADTREQCTCGPPSMRRVAQLCPVCVAWAQGQVLLADGTTVPKAPWLHAHRVPEEDPHG